MTLQNIDTDILKAAIEGVEDNNLTNSGHWSDWQSADEILDTYAAGEGCAEIQGILGRAIETNGESLATDLPAVELAVWGQNFSGSFWDRA